MKNLILTSLFLLAGVAVLAQEYITVPKNMGKLIRPRNAAADAPDSAKSSTGKETTYMSYSQPIDTSLFLRNIDGEMFWGRNYLGGKQSGDTSITKLTNTVNLGFSNSVNGLIYTELLASRIGVAKVSFGSVLVNTKDDTIKTAQQFLNGGGNAIIRAAIPFYYKLRYVPKSYQFCFTTLLVPRLSLNLPKAKDANTLRQWNMDVGVETHVFIASADDNLGLVAKLRIAGVYGSADFTESIIKKGQVFGYVQPSVGVYLLKSFLIQANIEPWIWGDKLQPIPATISVQTQF